MTNLLSLATDQLRATPVASLSPALQELQRPVATGGGVGLALLILAITLGYVVFWVWCLIHILTNKKLDSGNKVLWLLVIFLVHVLGPILYFLIGNKKK